MSNDNAAQNGPENPSLGLLMAFTIHQSLQRLLAISHYRSNQPSQAANQMASILAKMANYTNRKQKLRTKQKL